MINNISPLYIIDEKALSVMHKFEVHPLRVFNLETFGIPRESFLHDLKPTFSMLHSDGYDTKRARVEMLKKQFPEESERLNSFLVDYFAKKSELSAVFDLIARLSFEDRCSFDCIGTGGRRKRAIARFILDHKHADHWDIKRVPAKEFQQKVAPGDPRALIRVFHEMENLITDHPQVQYLMRCLANEIQQLRPEARRLQINAHQMFTIANVISSGSNAPEGIHQDGADFIVSALVIERSGIIGGESIVYGPDKKTIYLQRILAEGEGIFQADSGSPLWHYVTPIHEDPQDPHHYGHRSILGFDIDIIS